jgi:hypothetical protein
VNRGCRRNDALNLPEVIEAEEAYRKR